MNKLIGTWSFYKKIFYIAIPVMVQNLITNFVAMIDNIMVGQIGTEQMSGVAIVNQLLFVFNLTIFGATSGAGIFCAQFFGKKDMEGVKNTFRYKLITSCLITAVAVGVFLLLGDNLITMYLHDADKGIDLAKTFLSAKEYLLIMLVGLLPFSVENAYSSTLREGAVAMPSMVAGIVAVVTNTFLNWLLIFGIGPFPVMGVRGAAIATVISRFVQTGIVIVWTHAHSKELKYVKGLYKGLSVPARLVKSVTSKGLLPLMANELLWSMGVATLTQCYSMRGIDVVAGFNISNTVVNLFNVLFISFGSGVGVVMGQYLGANELKEAKNAAPKMMFFSFVMCAAVGAVMACFAGVFPLAYNTIDEVRELAKNFIFISAIFMPVHGMLNSGYFIMRSGGKTGITFIFDCGFSWFVSVPLAYALVEFTMLDIISVYFCVLSAEILKCIVGMLLIKKGVWLSNIVADK